MKRVIAVIWQIKRFGISKHVYLRYQTPKNITQVAIPFDRSKYPHIEAFFIVKEK